MAKKKVDPVEASKEFDRRRQASSARIKNFVLGREKILEQPLPKP